MKRLMLAVLAVLLTASTVFAAGRVMLGRQEHAPGQSTLEIAQLRQTTPDVPAVAGAAPVPQARTETREETAPGTLVRLVEVTYAMDIVNRHGDLASRDVTVTIPAAVTAVAGHQRVAGVRFDPEPTRIDRAGGTERAVYVIPALDPGATFSIRQTYEVELYGGAGLIESGAGPEIQPSWLGAEQGIETDNALIRARALEVTRNARTVEARATAIMDFVVERIRYNAQSPNRNQGALAGLINGEGVCTEYANLFVAMARASGIPARVVYGWAKDVPGPDFPTLLGALDGSTRHAWAEYLDPEKGWVPVDPTFATVRPTSERMAFDAANHVAQDFVQAPLRYSYRGGTLAVTQSTELGNLPLLQVAEIPAPAAAAAATTGPGTQESATGGLARPAETDQGAASTAAE